VSCPTYLINSIFFDEIKYTTINQAIYREIIFILNKIIQMGVRYVATDVIVGQHLLPFYNAYLLIILSLRF
jgi:hypothetical protein